MFFCEFVMILVGVVIVFGFVVLMLLLMMSVYLLKDVVYEECGFSGVINCLFDCICNKYECIIGVMLVVCKECLSIGKLLFIVLILIFCVIVVFCLVVLVMFDVGVVKISFFGFVVGGVVVVVFGVLLMLIYDFFFKWVYMSVLYVFMIVMLIMLLFVLFVMMV